MIEYRVKRGDTDRVVFTVRDAHTGAPVDLAGTTQRILVRRRWASDDTPTIVLPSAPTGEAGEIGWTPTWGEDALTVGDYVGEVEVRQGDNVSTSPSSGFFSLIIEADLPEPLTS